MRISLIAAFLVFVSSFAQAQMMIEPNLGIATGSLNGEGVNGAPLAPTAYNGLLGGLRLGYTFGKSFWFALDASHIIAKGKSNSTEYDITATDVGVVFGYNFSRYRLYAGYMPMSSSIHKDSTDQMKLTGTAMKVGFGNYLSAKWIVTLELLIRDYKKVGINGIEADTAMVYKKLNDAPFILTFGYVF